MSGKVERSETETHKDLIKCEVKNPEKINWIFFLFFFDFRNEN